jgi:hypothetical protein
MKPYKFPEEHAKIIVSAVVEGYRNYIDHRRDRKQSMKISSAFAWTKGNFIESKIADECEKFGFLYKKSKAGLTWDYLQFTDKDNNVLFLIKNAAYFDPKSFSKSNLPATSKKGAQRTYLNELSKINLDIDFSTIAQGESITSTKTSEQLSLFVQEKTITEEIKDFQSIYKQFHILTYEIDDAYQISSVKQYIPNSKDNIAYLIEDLSSYINGAELTDDDREIIAPTIGEDYLDPSLFDIGIIEDEEEI